MSVSPLYLSNSARNCSRLDSYFLFPPSQSPSYLSPFKQCLHLDPDSPSCLPAHRLAKSLGRGFSRLIKLMGADDWKGVLKHIVGSAKDSPGDGFARTFQGSLLENRLRTCSHHHLQSFHYQTFSPQVPVTLLSFMQLAEHI
ncbi:hypothetical protein M405DRAFT_25593 [Rhizopogon salebrosus TDB-379]|nr:hypothetical protein M405DRAFT_25593 [Rhizopogon salebrosus TDB-379]